MATSQRTIEFLLDQLAAVPGVWARKMFGEYALYCGEKVVALVCDDQLFVKITAPGRALVGERCAEGFPYPGAKPALLVGAGELEDHERLAELIRVTAAALPAPRAERKTTKKKTTKPKATKKTTTPKKNAKTPKAKATGRKKTARARK
jgi:TfoX/Sxy family transcriptional regulator of competence genes